MINHAIILGIGSDIGRNIARRLSADGWGVAGVHHNQGLAGTTPARWDLAVCCYGKLEPIGSFWDLRTEEWEAGVRASALLPLRQIRELYPRRNPGASVCFFSGAGTGGPARSYSAYAASKVMLVKMAELLDDESPDCKFFALGPGVVRTKIHNQTLAAGDRAANCDFVWEFLESDKPGTSMDDIYACLMACAAAPKHVIGGRNVHIPGDDWRNLEELATGSTLQDPNTWKLRRHGDDLLRCPRR